VSWPDERFIRGTLSTIRALVKAAAITRTALILVGPALGQTGFADSRLYAAEHSHVLRKRRLSDPSSQFQRRLDRLDPLPAPPAAGAP